MKLLSAAVVAALFSSSLTAQENDRQWQVSLFSDYVKSATAKEYLADWRFMEAGGSIGADLRTALDEHWDARAEFAFTKYDVFDDNGIKDSTRIGLDALYNFNDAVYGFVGYKRFNNVKSYNAFNLGAGYNYQLNDKITLFTEAAVYKDVDYGFVDQGIKLGFTYSFGATSSVPKAKSKAPVAPVATTPAQVQPETLAPKAVAKVMDSDKDGVIDSVDQCANTPVTDKVDAKGCTLFKENQVAIALDVNFDNDSAKIKNNEMRDIQRLAEFMNKYRDTSVVIEGHSSAVGRSRLQLELVTKTR